MPYKTKPYVYHESRGSNKKDKLQRNEVNAVLF
jgi:hypothetical protein